jgi:hypothetical protein
MSGKYGDLIKQARKPENQKISQTAPTDQTGERLRRRLSRK